MKAVPSTWSVVHAEDPPVGLLETNRLPLSSEATHSEGEEQDTASMKSSVGPIGVTVSAPVPPVGSVDSGRRRRCCRRPRRATRRRPRDRTRVCSRRSRGAQPCAGAAGGVGRGQQIERSRSSSAEGRGRTRHACDLGRPRHSRQRQIRAWPPRIERGPRARGGAPAPALRQAPRVARHAGAGGEGASGPPEPSTSPP